MINLHIKQNDWLNLLAFVASGSMKSSSYLLIGTN